MKSSLTSSNREGEFQSKTIAKAKPDQDDSGRNDQGRGAVVTIIGTTLNFNRAGDYTIEFNGAGRVKIQLDGGHTFNMSASQLAAIDTINLANPNARLTIDADILGSDSVIGAGFINITGVTFTEAGPGGPFEISDNLNNVFGSLIASQGIDHVLSHLSINGSIQDTFKAIWDYLDDAFVSGGNPFDVALNETFVRLGVAYVNYLEAGGEPFTDVTAKFAADTNGNGIPQREQSMHDNLLGNLTNGAIQSRFASDPELRDELLALVPDDYGARFLYEGLESQVGGPRHDNVRAFDYDRGWDRPDYFDRDYDALVDPAARDGGEMYYGDGNTITDWNVLRHEGAGVELALKVKHRTVGGDYPETSIGADGVAHYTVVTGSQPGVPNRAEWNFDFAATDFSPDDDFTYTVEIDLDPGAGVTWFTLFTSANDGDTDLGDGNTFQNSSNYAFYRNGIDIDPDMDGIQPYAFGPGQFNIRLSAFGEDGELVARNEIVVNVVDPDAVSVQLVDPTPNIGPAFFLP